MPLDDRFAGGAKCRKEKNGKGEEPLGLDSYTAYLFSNLRNEILQRRTTGLTAEEVLQKGYDYFNNAVKKTGKAESMDDYFYNLFDLREELQDISTNSQNDSDDDDFDEETLVNARLRFLREANSLENYDPDESSEESGEDETSEASESSETSENSETSESSETSGADESSTGYDRYDFGDSDDDETMNFDGSDDDNNESDGDNDSDSDNTGADSADSTDGDVRPAGLDTTSFDFGDESNGDEGYSSDSDTITPVATRTIRLGEQGQSENFETDLSAAYDTSEAELDNRGSY